MKLSIIDSGLKNTGRLGSRMSPLKFVVDENDYRVARIFKREDLKRGAGTYWVIKVVDDKGCTSYAFDYRDNPDAISDYHFIGEFKTIREVLKAVANITADDLNRRSSLGWINETALHPSTK